MLLFGQLLETFGLLFTTTSGHTGCGTLICQSTYDRWPQNANDLSEFQYLVNREQFYLLTTAW